ncbi:hypothetical protein EFN70_02935 [Pediococcus ethanolidurans]|uniref:hypothetical protein n=1 Tax=Pediococcus ethanolidurans TaxID=319653 RepID=UPI0021AAA09A|nr:hypothetical protein [Pediococcus ethanolidurans]MCT4397636.1 hypothetical protein [Pediococcus ethanolidurans]
MAEIASFGVNVDQNTRLAQNAQDTANDANKKNSANSQQIANINDPNYLTPFEKPQLEIQMDNFATIYKTDKDIATAEGIDFTAYDAAYQAYLAYMTPLTADISTYSPIVRATFNSLITAFQNAKTAFDAATKAQYTQAMDKAKTDIANNQSSYAAMKQDVATMKTNANSVATIASAAISSAGFANDTASTASQAANDAKTIASQAANNVAIAKNDASDAVATANSTASEFGKVSQKTDSALTNAKDAQTNANTALDNAKTALDNAKTAQDSADSIKVDVDDVKGTLDSKADKTSVDAVTKRVTTNATNITQNAKDITTKANQTDVDAATKRVSTAETNITQNANSIKSKASQSDVTALTGRVSTAETNITQNAKDITSKASQTDVDTLTGRVKDDESSITQNAKDITSKVSSSDVQGLLDKGGYATQTWTGSQIQQSADEINSTVTSVSNKVDNLQIGGRNYYQQNTPVQIIQMPTSTYKPSFTRPSVDSPNGFKLTGAKDATGTVRFNNVITGNGLWTVSFWMRNNQGSAQYLTLDACDLLPVKLYTSADDTWRKYIYTVNITNYSATYNFVDFKNMTWAWFLIKDFKVETGNKATDWSPAPEDTATVTAVSKLSQTVDGMKSDISKKIEQKDLNGYATQTWAQNQINATADGIKGTLSSVKSTVNGHTTSINDLKADSSSFKSQFTTVNNTLGKHTTDIGTLQASSKELTSGFNTLTTDNNTNKNDISQLKQTATEVSSTLETVQTQVKNSAVGTNYIISSKLISYSPYNTKPIATNDGKKISTTYISTTFTLLTIGVSGFKPIGQYTMSGKMTINGAPVTSATFKNHASTYNAPYTATDTHKIDDNGNFVFTETYTGSGNWLMHTPITGIKAGDVVVIEGLKFEKGSVATDWCPNPADNATVTALTQVKQTAEGAEALATNNHGDIAKLQITAKGLQTSVSNAATKDQLTILSSQLTNQITDLKSSTNSQFTQTASDMDLLVKKGDVVNQFNIDAGGALLQTVGGNTKIVLSAPNIIFDTANPVQIPNANIEDTLTGKTIEAGTITATTKIIGSDIEAALVHSKDNSFKLDGTTGDIVGASIHAADNSWGISNAGKIHGTSITASVMDISGDGKGPNFDAVNVTPDTTQGIYSRYKYSVNSGYDVNKFGRTLYKNGYLVINGDTFLNRAIGDWSADGGGKYVYDTMYEAHTIKMRAYNYTGSNVQTDDPSSTEGSISSRLDIQPSAITMGRDWSVGNPNILIDGNGLLKVGSIAINGHHSMGTTDGSDMYFMQMNKDATDVSGTSIPIHAARYYTANMGISGGHVINSYDGGDVYLKDKWGSGGNTVSLHVKKLYSSSLLSLKTDITTIDPNDALETIANTDFRSYRFKTDDPSEPKSVSPILDDENQIPIYNTPNIFKSADGKSRNDGNILGYTALSVQALYAKIKDLTTRLQKLEGAN